MPYKINFFNRVFKIGTAPKHFLWLVLLLFSMINITSAQDTIYLKKRGEENWKNIGKCEEKNIFRISVSQDNWRLFGKFEDELIYYRQVGKENWGLIGKFENNLYYQKLPGKDRWVEVGKFEDGLIYQKIGKKDKWRLVGKCTNPFGAALLLLHQDGDTGAVIII
jgi:hypothetical protein